MADIGTGVAETGQQQAASGAGQAGTNAGSTQVAEQQVFVDASGKLSPGWKERYVPEDIRGEKIFDTYTDLTGIAKSLAYYNKRLRDGGKGVPDESWPTSELETYHRMRGRPEKPEYGLKRDERIPEEYYDPDRAKRFQEFAWKTGLTAKEVAALDQWNNQEVIAGVQALKEQQAEEQKLAIAEAETVLLEKCGNNLDMFKHLSNKFIEENTANLKPEEKEKFLDVINDPRIAPYLVPIFAQVERKRFSEGSQVSDFENPARALGPAEALSKAKQMMAVPAYANGTMHANDRAGYDEYQKKIDELVKLSESLNKKVTA